MHPQLVSDETVMRHRAGFDDDVEPTEISLSQETREAYLLDQVPRFHCPDLTLEATYYFRWWTYFKHLRRTPIGWIVTEFLPHVAWAGLYNSINCSAAHHLYEGRWLRNRQDFLPDYIRFWFHGGGEPRKYSTWLSAAVWNYCLVDGRFELAFDLLDAMVSNQEAWIQSHRHASGLFWSSDDRDGMEYSISGPGLRPSVNAYVYGDARAISQVARMADRLPLAMHYQREAEQLQQRIVERLWDPKEAFFKTIPLAHIDDRVSSWDFSDLDQERNVRELIGFLPWYFHMSGISNRPVWHQLMDPERFSAPFGPTTAERRHPRFMFANPSHECLWNGPSWPFATSQVLTAMANALHQGDPAVAKDGYLVLLETYARSQRLVREEAVSHWIDENLEPFTGQWLSRNILQAWRWPENKGGRERGRDYNHSTFCDLIISGLIGVRPEPGANGVWVRPMVSDAWPFFCLEDVPYRGHNLTIWYDRTGRQYGRGRGLVVAVDGLEVIRQEHIGAVRVPLR